MCGLCGVYGDVNYKAKAALSNLMFFSQLRGVDSTGVAFIPSNPKQQATVYKEVGGVESLMTSFPREFTFKRRLVDKPGNFLAILSHHRAATVGVVNEDNAHPFIFDNIIGTHNGTIPYRMYSTLPTHKPVKTDSEICLGFIDTFEEPHKAFEKIGGEYAFVWFDQRDDTLCLARNAHRSLFSAKTRDGKTIFYASEAWMLHIALTRAGVEWGTLCKDKSGKEQVKFEVREVLPNKVHRFGLNDKDEVIIYSSEPMVPFKEPVFVSNYTPSTTKNWWDWGEEDKQQGKEQKKVTQLCKPPANREEFVEDYAPYVANQMLHKSRWLKLVDKGCNYCGSDILWEHRNDVNWVDRDTVLCFKCESEKHGKAN